MVGKSFRESPGAVGKSGSLGKAPRQAALGQKFGLSNCTEWLHLIFFTNISRIFWLEMVGAAGACFVSQFHMAIVGISCICMKCFRFNKLKG